MTSIDWAYIAQQVIMVALWVLVLRMVYLTAKEEIDHANKKTMAATLEGEPTAGNKPDDKLCSTSVDGVDAWDRALLWFFG